VRAYKNDSDINLIIIKYSKIRYCLNSGSIVDERATKYHKIFFMHSANN
jgi:hypothetical protein